jgi:hypothetical protein
LISLARSPAGGTYASDRGRQPLHLRRVPAGVAVVERSGATMLEMLKSHTLGEDRSRFSNLIATTAAQSTSPDFS